MSTTVTELISPNSFLSFFQPSPPSLLTHRYPNRLAATITLGFYGGSPASKPLSWVPAAAIFGKWKSHCSEDSTNDTDSVVLDENELIPVPVLKEYLKE